MTPSVNGARLQSNLEQLGEIWDATGAPFTRRAFTEVYLQGRAWLREKFKAAGLAARLDAAATLSGRWQARQWDGALMPLMLGSHTDTVEGGGRYDGIAGVLSALEVFETPREHAVPLRHPIEVVDFLSEEPSEYGVSCVGSRALAGRLDREMLESRNPSGDRLADGITRMGGDPERIAAGRLRRAAHPTAYLELHIEQGPMLEREGVDIGVVTGIAGIRRYEVRIVGRPDHAGTTPMHLRKDALVAGASIVRSIHRLALEMNEEAWLTATVGKVDVTPNAMNVVPGQVRLYLEVRALEADPVSRFEERFGNLVSDEGAASGAQIEVSTLSRSEPVVCSSFVQDAVERACETEGLSHTRMASGAGHDAAFLAQICPVGMLFVPSHLGISHAAQEYTSPQALAKGAQALLSAVLELDQAR